jgi:mono/diheme cytochrome c family protein
LVALAVLVAAVLFIGVALDKRTMDRPVDVPVKAVALPPADARALERGRCLFASRGCTECHGADGAGRDRPIGHPLPT